MIYIVSCREEEHNRINAYEWTISISTLLIYQDLLSRSDNTASTLLAVFHFSVYTIHGNILAQGFLLNEHNEYSIYIIRVYFYYTAKECASWWDLIKGGEKRRKLFDKGEYNLIEKKWESKSKGFNLLFFKVSLKCQFSSGLEDSAHGMMMIRLLPVLDVLLKTLSLLHSPFFSNFGGFLPGHWLKIPFWHNSF